MPLKEFAEFDRRPILVALAGPNGAGKTTFFHAHLAAAGLRFLNADVLAAELSVEAANAARLANALRETLVERGESFVFETVFSDPVGDKVEFLAEAAERGYVVILCYIGLSEPAQSVERMAMRSFARRSRCARRQATIEVSANTCQSSGCHRAVAKGADLRQ